MAVTVRTEIEYNHQVDHKTNRHSINGTPIVLHCHHYTALYTQLAIDAGETRLLKDCARESFRKMLSVYFERTACAADMGARIEMCCQYYSLVGLGRLDVVFLGDDGGRAELSTSHTDNGWMKKFGTYDRPVNYITAGFVEALFEVILGCSAGSFEAVETQSIVSGAEKSIFTVIRG